MIRLRHSRENRILKSRQARATLLCEDRARRPRTGHLRNSEQTDDLTANTELNDFVSDASSLHAQQVAYWNGPGAALWVTRPQRMDAGLAPMADAAITLAAVRPGERVLDIVCDSGATSIALAGLVGPTGHVTGPDVSGPLNELVRKRSVGVDNLDWMLADAAA